jgi:pimeloyl-ACP methyl ester carboxylesterase
MASETGLFVERGGDGEPVLLLLHGLGATGAVWRGLAELLPDRWPGGWLVPDLPGHGRSPWVPRYSFGRLAAEVAEVAEVADGGRLVVLGHSLGGVVGLALASGWFGVSVDAVCGLGIKLRWSAEDLARAADLAARPSRVFATRDEAAERALKVAGLAGLVPADSPAVDAGLAQVDGTEGTDGGWRLALDPAAFGVGAPDIAGLLAASRAEVLLAAGEHDAMCPTDHLRAAQPDGVVLGGLGHNAHVEDPGALWPLLDRLREVSDRRR